MSLEEQLRNEAQSLREIKWFNLAGLITAAADDIHRLNDRIKRLEETLEKIADALDETKETKP